MMAGLFLAPFWTMAAQAKSSAPVQISANKLSFNQKSGVGVYEGAVNLRQGDLNLRANALSVRIDNGLLKTAEATGDVKFEHIIKGKKATGSAKKLMYDGQAGELVGDATLLHDGNQMRADRIRFDINGNLSATGGQNQVQMTLLPQSSSGNVLGVGR